jgi:hypothetical protein
MGGMVWDGNTRGREAGKRLSERNGQHAVIRLTL